MSAQLTYHIPGQQRSFTTIGELRQHAHVDKSDTESYSVKSWINAAIQVYEKGDYAMRFNDLENAYINYFRGCSIMTEIVKLHSNYHEIRLDPLYLRLKKRTNEEIFVLLNDLALKIQARYATKQYPYASYAYRPSHDPRNFPHYTLSDIPYSPSQKAPSWTNNQFPNKSTVEPIELANWITTKRNPPSILVVDLRPREAFKNGCIKHSWIMQIDPLVLQTECTMVTVQESLRQHPRTEQAFFQELNQFDLIVFYDQNSKTMESAYNPPKYFAKLLYTQSLRWPPMMLAGGFDAWVTKIGERGVYRFLKEKKAWFRNSNSSNSSTQSDNDHHSLYDYVRKKQANIHQQDHMNPIIKPEPLPTAPRKESLTTRYPELVSPTTEVPTALMSPQQPPQQSQNVTPLPPSYPKLHRRRTFIDNPFNGFTTTTSKLYDILDVQHINRQNKAGSGGILVESFAGLVRVMWSESYRFVSPMTFREAFVRVAPRFNGHDQQDSQEFLMVLLDGLHEDLNEHGANNRITPASAKLMQNEKQFEKLPDWQASAISWELYLSKNSSIIVSLFQGQYRSRLTCLSCKQTSTTYNAFMSLSLPIPAKKLRLSSATLYQCLDYFVKEETLEKEDAWKCPNCQKKRKASKQLILTKLPDILLIHLKRFSMDGLFRNKLDTFVKCPTRSLDLSEYVTSPMTPSSQDRSACVYDLYAVSNHYGSLNGGHYTACVRDGYKDKWTYFDDSKVSICDESKVITKAAYNLFYVRSKVK
ncbi:ubiquitin-specific protease doa4 [Rhizopus stolonifer]|uniref:ubiquitinyl hydrolase 1 n=1 Tax=Rhizopus stolonifer TaxID=4846 RepID=A0A367KHR9_RHIST|nr:ubiquitin-specific protease doa4 [Rhizopus stolonifer]